MYQLKYYESYSLNLETIYKNFKNYTDWDYELLKDGIRGLTSGPKYYEHDQQFPLEHLCHMINYGFLTERWIANKFNLIPADHWHWIWETGAPLSLRKKADFIDIFGKRVELKTFLSKETLLSVLLSEADYCIWVSRDKKMYKINIINGQLDTNELNWEFKGYFDDKNIKYITTDNNKLYFK